MAERLNLLRSASSPPCVGIMADSHGRPEAIQTAVEFLKGSGCGALLHLGDICDSSHPETADRCVRLLQENRVTAVKGNNDHAVVVNQQEHRQPDMSPGTLSYLRALPLVVTMEGAVFAHSLPFPDELGAACMMRAMDRQEMIDFFRKFPGQILFRGHSHQPEFMHREKGRQVVEGISAGGEIDLSSGKSAVITCGALTRGFCMLWEPLCRRVRCASMNIRHPLCRQPAVSP